MLFRAHWRHLVERMPVIVHSGSTTEDQAAIAVAGPRQPRRPVNAW